MHINKKLFIEIVVTYNAAYIADWIKIISLSFIFSLYLHLYEVYRQATMQIVLGESEAEATRYAEPKYIEAR